MAASSNVRGSVDCRAHLLEGAAAADIGDGLVDVLIARLRLFLEQGRDRHDHSALAIAPLRNIIRNPGLLHLVQRVAGGETLDAGDLLADGIADRHAAGAYRRAIDMNDTGAALCNAATVFCSG